MALQEVLDLNLFAVSLGHFDQRHPMFLRHLSAHPPTLNSRYGEATRTSGLGEATKLPNYVIGGGDRHLKGSTVDLLSVYIRISRNHCQRGKRK